MLSNVNIRIQEKLNYLSPKKYKERALNSHIRNLRNKSGDKAKHITTIFRVGYKFEGDV
ncbi:hypothetical protein COI83_26415 [Bacillus cereus]|nr:hypothetical protein COI83_26415 [Bacillus cereus]